MLGIITRMEKPPLLPPEKKTKQWSIGELQAMRSAWRFMVGLASLAIIVSLGLLFLFLNLSPEQKSSDVHKHDVMTGMIVLTVAAACVVAGWKLRSYVKKCERETGQSSKPFGWMP
jgi:cytochrome bd-type quinol oxidase subunit 1